MKDMKYEDIDFIEISKRRITTRSFAPVEVEQEKIDKILEAGQYAPTAVNFQPQRILVLNTRESLEKVKEFCTFNYNKDYAELDSHCDDKEHGKCVYYYGAPLVLFVCYDKEGCWKHPENGELSGPTDAAIVSTQMMLEAASIGLGTVWISYFDKDKARELLKLPDNWEPLNMLYIGYPAEDFQPNTKMSTKRNPVEASVWYNELDEKAYEKRTPKMPK